MNKELEKVCEELALEAVKNLPQRYDGRYHPKTVGKEWFKAGFQAAIESEQVTGLVDVLKMVDHVGLIEPYDRIVKEAIEAWEEK